MRNIKLWDDDYYLQEGRRRVCVWVMMMDVVEDKRAIDTYNTTNQKERRKKNIIINIG